MRRRRIRGKTLLEVVIIISMMGLVVGLAATSLATLFRLRQQMSRDSEQAAVLARLGTRLRLDAHEAVAVALNDGCLLTLPDGRSIQYTFAAQSITREVKRDATVVHRDRFLLPKSAGAEFSRDGESPSAMVRLSIRPIEVKTRNTEMPRTTTIEAVVGLNRALAQTERQP
jgi:type II secretory pathway pseudopilin PulG